MRTEHSATYAYQATRVAVDLARESCVHWDYNSNPDGADAPCCRAVREAREKYRIAKRAWIEETTT